ncbi:MAG: 5-methyltetrahydropteroyltriglutamate--homocysteine S-methyltransferase [Coriobacteriia bacterium]|nr:5-methyltetrahydropteroyltriglutamate--homocysteine S-methyltransferase [Coriobacteriia bacterium]
MNTAHTSLSSACLGYPRIGANRELKWALESFWRRECSTEELLTKAQARREANWRSMADCGLTFIPSNDFSLYDHVLDMAVAVGAVPAVYRGIADPLERYFAMARGHQDQASGVNVPALEMTKWFDTNYHYIVPELEADQGFTLDSSKIVGEFEEARALGIVSRPVVVGPVTFLLLSKMAPGTDSDVQPIDLIDRLLPLYEELLGTLAARGVEWVQLDEPCLVLDLDDTAKAAYGRAFDRLGAAVRPQIMLTTYYGELADNLPLALNSGFDGLHLDLVRAPEQLEAVAHSLPGTMCLSLGVIDGRNVWRTDLDAARTVLARAVEALGAERVVVAPSCSLLHVPVDLVAENGLSEEPGAWMAFAAQKLVEVEALASGLGRDADESALFSESRSALASRRASNAVSNDDVRARMEQVTEEMLHRGSPYKLRITGQRKRFDLPLLPTTTIGSFPQTAEVREQRRAWRGGKSTAEDYERFLREETSRCVAIQEEIGLDVLVHGEFERTDMVEYFGEQLDGFAFTRNGWVQSYGSRCVKPPVLFGDVSRPKPMTVDWSTYAQSLTGHPVKGMLTGPVTILQWSFVRDDQERSETCRQIARALRDEVVDLEAAGIGMIQVDEPALREGLPLRRGLWGTYLRWAVDAFRLATCGVRDETQIHTHMCYSEFGDILPAIVDLDSDVLSIETSRSKMELLGDFAETHYPNELGPGVYDIHSPRIPSVEEIVALLEKAIEIIPVERLWVNPDCGLKTRGWPEVTPALQNMVRAASDLRARLEPKD